MHGGTQHAKGDCARGEQSACLAGVTDLQTGLLHVRLFSWDDRKRIDLMVKESKS